MAFRELPKAKALGLRGLIDQRQSCRSYEHPDA